MKVEGYIKSHKRLHWVKGCAISLHYFPIYLVHKKELRYSQNLSYNTKCQENLLNCNSHFTKAVLSGLGLGTSVPGPKISNLANTGSSFSFYAFNSVVRFLSR